MSRPIVLLSDFGARDASVGQMRAVIAGIAPSASTIDLTHEIEPFAVDEGAWTLDIALSVLPSNAVVLAVVDPGVGGIRRPIAIQSGGRSFIGPDNGLLSAAFDQAHRIAALPGRPAQVRLSGGAPDVRELTNPQFQRAHVSPTFHGRDIFAPAAAYLAAGLDFRHLGAPRHDAWVYPPFAGDPGPLGELRAAVIHVDRFGNLITTIRAAEIFPLFTLEIGGETVDQRVRTFSEAPNGAPFCYADSSGYLGVAVDQGSAAERLGASRGTPVTLRSR